MAASRAEIKVRIENINWLKKENQDLKKSQATLIRDTHYLATTERAFHHNLEDAEKSIDMLQAKLRRLQDQNILFLEFFYPY